MSNENFFGDGYEPPKTKNKYTKFEKGETSFRVITTSISGVEFWKKEGESRVPVRYPKNAVPNDEFIRANFEQNRSGDYGKDFLAFGVYNHKEKCVQLCELTQVSLIRSLYDYAKNPKWGNPSKYDIVVTKEGEGINTTYKLMPDPPCVLPDEVMEEVINTPLNLNALFEGGDPFEEKVEVPGEGIGG